MRIQRVLDIRLVHSICVHFTTISHISDNPTVE